LGFPFPETTAHIIATGEIIGGLLLIFGLFTRITALYFIAQMIVAVISTKIDLYFGRSPLPMPPAPPKMGVWAVLHEIRSDYAQILSCLFLLVEGAGRRSLDFVISTSKNLYSMSDNSDELPKEPLKALPEKANREKLRFPGQPVH
jgi:putative oxidoreductase